MGAAAAAEAGAVVVVAADAVTTAAESVRPVNPVNGGPSPNPDSKAVRRRTT